MAEAASVFHSGFEGTATILVSAVQTELALIRWDIIPTAKLVEFMNSRSGLYPVREATFRDLTGSIDIDYDFANPIYSTSAGGMNLQPGTTISQLKLYLDQTSRYSGSGLGTGSLDGPYWYIASALINAMPQSLTNDGKITTRISWATASATITYPS